MEARQIPVASAPWTTQATIRVPAAMAMAIQIRVMVHNPARRATLTGSHRYRDRGRVGALMPSAGLAEGDDNPDAGSPRVDLEVFAGVDGDRPAVGASEQHNPVYPRSRKSSLAGPECGGDESAEIP